MHIEKAVLKCEVTLKNKKFFDLILEKHMRKIQRR